MYSVLLYVFIIHYCIFYMCDYCVPMDNVDNIEILGMILSSDGKCINQVDSRI